MEEFKIRGRLTSKKLENQVGLIPIGFGFGPDDEESAADAYYTIETLEGQRTVHARHGLLGWLTTYRKANIGDYLELHGVVDSTGKPHAYDVRVEKEISSQTKTRPLTKMGIYSG